MLGAETDREEDDVLVGETLSERWRVLRLIGRGGMSKVYEAEHRNGSRVALKVLSPMLARNARTRERFLREGRLANGVGHPNAVRILDEHQTADGKLFLVMDLLDGKTLREACAGAGGKLDIDEALRMADGVLEVLVFAHAKGIVHRDIKPENVFLTRSGQIKVLDFGVASVRDAAAQDATVTQSGMVLGTPAFMAPEQARGRQTQIDARTDIWAVGATLFFALTGRLVHQGAGTANEALIFAATQPAPPVSRFRPEVATDVARIVDRGLALAPEDRWQSAEAMRRAIVLARARIEGAAPVEPPDPVYPTAPTLQDSERGSVVPRLSQRNTRAIASVIGVVALAGMLLYLRSSGQTVGTVRTLSALGAEPSRLRVAGAGTRPETPPSPDRASEKGVYLAPAPVARRVPSRSRRASDGSRGTLASSRSVEPRDHKEVAPGGFEDVPEPILDRRK